MSALRNIRLLPVVLVAVAALALLKTLGLVFDGHYLFGAAQNQAQSKSQLSWAQDMLNYPGGTRPASEELDDITGAAGGGAPKPAAPETKPAELKPLEGVPIFPDPRQQIPQSERAVLERLQDRRQELETRARELDIRENLLKAAEKRLEGKTDELKAIEQRIAAATQKKEEADNARLKGVVTMYEGMKPKDAARIFDRLDMAVLYEIVSQVKPAKMAEILAAMSPEAAERLTTELARRAGTEKSSSIADLPKIEGKPLVR